MAILARSDGAGLLHWPDTDEWLTVEEFMERFYKKYPEKQSEVN